MYPCSYVGFYCKYLSALRHNSIYSSAREWWSEITDSSQTLLQLRACFVWRAKDMFIAHRHKTIVFFSLHICDVSMLSWVILHFEHLECAMRRNFSTATITKRYYYWNINLFLHTYTYVFISKEANEKKTTWVDDRN